MRFIEVFLTVKIVKWQFLLDVQYRYIIQVIKRVHKYTKKSTNQIYNDDKIRVDFLNNWLRLFSCRIPECRGN